MDRNRQKIRKNRKIGQFLKLSFFRSFKFHAEVAKTPRLFNLKLGLSGPLDPESGMSVNLVEMDKWAWQAIELVQKGQLQSEDGVLEAVVLCIEDQLSTRKSIGIERVEIQDLVSQNAWMRESTLSQGGRLGETLEASQRWVVKSDRVCLLEEWPDHYVLRDPALDEALCEKGRFFEKETK